MKPTYQQIERATRQAHQEFLRQLAAQSKTASQRLNGAYKRVLDLLKINALDMDTNALSRLKARVQQALDGMAPTIEVEAKVAQAQGVQASTKIASASLEATGLSNFMRPAPEYVAKLIHYADSPAFRATLANYGSYHAQSVVDLIISAASQGTGVDAIVRQVRAYLQVIPRADAGRTVRTLQLYSARAGMREIYQMNRDVLKGWIWSSARDARTCPSCWSMDGTFHTLDEMCNDHHSGRCSMAPVTTSMTDWEIADLPQRIGGEEAFSQLSAKEQRGILGPAKYDLWRAGELAWSAMSTTYQNDVYGMMRREATLDEIRSLTAASVRL